MPRTLGAADAYRERMLEGDTLHVNAWARERARSIVLEPPVPLAIRPLVQAANFPVAPTRRIRQEYGLAAAAAARAPRVGRRRRRVRQARAAAADAERMRFTPVARSAPA